jgi:hypothetical protein
MDEIAQIAGRDVFQAAVRSALAGAASAGWRELWLCDSDFANWPLGERGVIESLTQWAGPQRRLTVLAVHYEEIARRHPRWTHWRRDWAHVVHCRALPEVRSGDVPVLLRAPGALTLRLLDPVRYRGTVSRLPVDGLQTDELIDAITQRSVEAFPATTLGL